MFLNCAERDAQALGDGVEAVTFRAIEQKDFALSRAQRVDPRDPMPQAFLAVVNRVGQWIRIDEREPLQRAGLDASPRLAFALIHAQI